MLLVALVFALTPSRVAFASSLTIAWDPSVDPEVTGYVVLYGTQSGIYTTRLDAGGRTSQQVSGLTDGVTYYFAVEAYDTRGLFSVPSQELSGMTGLPSASPLTISCPAPSATSYDGRAAVLNFSPVVNGGIQPVRTVCTPPSGTAFPVGTTAISCTATDAALTTASCTTSASVVSNPGQSSFDFEGIASELNGQCPILAFSAGSHRVYVDGQTAFNQGLCQSLKAGTRVHVIGVARYNGVVSASSITIVTGADGTAPAFEFIGTVESINGQCPILAFSAASYRVYVDGQTAFDQGSCSSLNAGTRVHVIGVARYSGVVSATSVAILP
jgi:hypothetical protein